MSGTCFLVLLAVLFAGPHTARTSNSEWQHTNCWAVEVLGGRQAADDLAHKHGLLNYGQVGNLKDVYQFVLPENVADRGRSEEPMEQESMKQMTKALESEYKVGLVELQTVRKRVKKRYSPPSDPLWDDQWFLVNTGQFGPQGLDLNVEGAWIQGITGCNRVVAIVDDGVEYTHRDLASNYAVHLGYDYLSNDNDPFPIPGDSHGTRCAGEIGMVKDNSVCGVGVAHQSTITGIRLLGFGVTDMDEAGALSHLNDIIEIYSNSWGPPDTGSLVDGPGTLVQRVFETGAREGRDGKGTIWVFAAGNGGHYDSCAADGYVSSIYTIGIGSAASDGSLAYYDEECSGKMAVVFVNNPSLGPSVSTTTTSGGCTASFDGTSAACPLVSGVIALTLEANFNLTWRDVQYLIAYTSNSEILTVGEWQTNGAGLNVSHKFGFGAIDAEAMVTRARRWISVPVQQSESMTPTPPSGTASITSPYTTTFSYHGAIGYIEHVVVVMTLNSGDRGDARVELMSPSGTRSTLLNYRPFDSGSGSYTKWPFMSVHFWGENPSGDWTLTIQYQNSFGSVNISDLNTTFYGTIDTPDIVQRIPSQCDSACARTRGCAAPGPEFCDVCANLRHAETLECISQCPIGFTERNGYCYNATRPEPECLKNNTGSCAAAGYTNCCTGASCLGNPPTCFCDESCYTHEDCCDDIADVCVQGSCVEAGYTSCCTNGSCTGNPPTCQCDEACFSRGDCCLDVLDTCIPELAVLPFLEFGTLGITSLPSIDVGISAPISIPGGFPFGNTIQTVVYIGTKGYFSFGTAVNDYTPSLFPAEHNYLVAPFWADIDITSSGQISYETHVASGTVDDDDGSGFSGNSPLPTTSISLISQYISDIEGIQFSGRWMLLAKWNEVPQYGGLTSVTNTIQAILITNGSHSYALFTYKCGMLEWSGGATIGFIADSGYYQNHPLSGASAINIACLFSPASEFSNVMYELALPGVIPPTTTPTTAPTPTPTGCVAAGSMQCCGIGPCYIPAGNCFCDLFCYSVNDCCEDIEETCLRPQGNASDTHGSGSGGSSGAAIALS